MNPLNEHFHSPPLLDYISLKIRFKKIKINEHVVSVRTFKSKGCSVAKWTADGSMESIDDR